MALIDIAYSILKEYEFEVKPNRVFFGFSNGKKIKLKNNITEEQFFNLFSKICELIGMPVCVHHYYGFVWKNNGEFLALNTIEESYGSDVTSIFVFSKMPIGKKLSYDYYTQIEEIVKQVFSDHNLTCNRFVHYRNRKFLFLGDNAETECLLIVKRQFLEFYCSSKVPLDDRRTKIIPRYSRKEKILLSDISTIKQSLQKCFVVD